MPCHLQVLKRLSAAEHQDQRLLLGRPRGCSKLDADEEGGGLPPCGLVIRQRWVSCMHTCAVSRQETARQKVEVSPFLRRANRLICWLRRQLLTHRHISHCNCSH